MRTAVWLSLLFCASLPAQPLYVYSEFVTLDAQGKAAAPPRPREILSPAIVRNAFASFQVVVEAEASKSWWLHVGLNPEQAVQVTLYRQKPDQPLEKVEFPVKGQGTQVFWMDLWTSADSQTGRIKVEPQLNLDDDWMIYPMEVRVQDPVVPKVDWKPRANAPEIRAVMAAFVCQKPVAGSAASSDGYSPIGLRYRNALQDLALAKQANQAELQKAFGPCSAPEPANPEAYYAIRDLLFTHTLH